jgi:hypothetical protein
MDAQIAVALTAEGYRTARMPRPFTGKVVWSLREKWQIPTVKLNKNEHNPLQWEDGTYSVEGALDQPPLEALRSLFQEDLTARPRPQSAAGGLWDRAGRHWVVVDVDGTRQAARQRALPQTAELPSPHRRLEQVCAAGYLGRKRGEVVRTRTTVLQAAMPLL